MGFAETKPKGEDATATAPRSALWQLWSDYLAGLVAAALLLGIAVGIFFGEYCSALSLVGDAFVGLLRMTVLSLIHI